MNVLLSLEHRFERTPDGAVWTQAESAYPWMARYLEVFDEVRVLARVLDVPTVPPDWLRADGPGVSFAVVPYYLGPQQYLLRARAVRRAVRAAVTERDAILLRVSSLIADTTIPILQRTAHPYGVEVIGDPLGVFAPGAVRHPLRPLFHWWFPRQLRRECAGAAAAAYVTRAALQQRYPPAPGAYSTSFSDVELPATAFVPTPRPLREQQGPFMLTTVGSLAQLYKAPDVLIDAVALVVQAGLDVQLVLIGDGRHRAELAERAARRGLDDRVTFRGQLTAGAPIQAELDRADLFVLPSRTEGLPRAMLEAMARAVPCLGSAVGGIPELLPPEDLVPAGDAAALARAIEAVLRDPARMARMSATNLARAGEYGEALLHERRIQFFRQLRQITADWLASTKH